MALLRCLQTARTPAGWGAIVAAVAIGCLAFVPGALAGTLSEYQLKGAFLFNFAKFVHWPPSALEGRDEFVICLAGDSDARQEVGGVVAGKKVDGRAVVVLESIALDAAARCHILFLAGSAEASVKEVVAATRGSHILTVGETRGFSSDGGMIEFVRKNKKLRFEISTRAAEGAGLSISSHLLKLAHRVHE